MEIHHPRRLTTVPGMLIKKTINIPNKDLILAVTTLQATPQMHIQVRIIVGRAQQTTTAATMELTTVEALAITTTIVAIMALKAATMHPIMATKASILQEQTPIKLIKMKY